MTFLSRKLAEIRDQHSNQHGSEQAQVLGLGEMLKRQNAQLNDAIDDILETHASDRAVIHQKLLTLAHSVGKLPQPATPEQRAIDAAIDGADVSTGDLTMPRVVREIANQGSRQQGPLQ